MRSGYLILGMVALICCVATGIAQEHLASAWQSMRPRKVHAAPKSKAKSKPKVLSARDIKEAKEKLVALGYWLTGAEDSFRQAVIAFQKVHELPRTGKLTFDELEFLRAVQAPAPKEIKDLAVGKIRFEIDLRRQVLFVIDAENKVTRILTVSSGNGKEFESEGFERDAITPPGRFNIYNKIKGWKKSPLGMLYYPNYYLSGLAIHGSLFVPPYPDSHGCIRIPMFAAEEFYRMAEMGTEVLVYESKPPQVTASDAPAQ